MPDFHLTPLDMAAVVVSVTAVVGIALWVGRKQQGSESFFLAGRTMVWPVVGFSLYATQFGGTQYLGLAGAGFESGISVWNYEWVATLVLLVFALLILPFYLQTKITTVPEFLERRYDRRARYAFSGFTVVTAMLLDSAGAMFAGSLVLSLLFPEVPLGVHIAIIALLGGGYVLVGGLKSVMITDTIQGVVLFSAGAGLFITVFAQFDFDWSVLPELAPEGGFTVAPPADDDFLPWPGIFTGAIWLSFYVWVTNHIVVQRVLAAKNIDHGRWGALFAGALQLPVLVLLIFPGVLGRGVYDADEVPDSDMIWPALIFDFVPVGLRGIIIAALLFALMSTLDSVLNGAASLVVNDFIKTRRREFTERQLLAIGRILVGVFLVAASLWAPVITTFSGIVAYFQSFLGYVTMPLVVVLLGGLFWKRASVPAGIWTLSVVPFGLLAFFLTEVFGVFDIQFLYATGIMLLLSLAVFVAVSLATPAPPEDKVSEITWSTATWRKGTEDLAGTPWYKNYRVLALALGAATVCAVVPFI
ncbi:SSS family solute:Na+ symporter [Nocardiopsis sp. Huas11]|uniref:sodium:solute symporter family transporter n=1 Tax=Nocardiopsis sp. Huas11 TaxID=2183912 RepID=UPI000EAB7C23|nr:sodium/solute symporter [Nocardiopsis sp. Huas11]RKS09339.1 SSS family solute:Na+ symporter [Nocardiopsis sp. Huas11]